MRPTTGRVLLGLFIPFFLLVSIFAIGLRPASATGETYALAISPDFAQEGGPSEVTLSLTVDNARASELYEFDWTVTDPANVSRTATNSTISQPGRTSFTLTLVYPRDFPGAKLNLVGAYNVTIRQNIPSSIPNVATGSFSGLLTDRPRYERTLTVSVRAVEYGPAENVTINLTKDGVSIPGFPVWTIADSLGVGSLTWQIPVQAALGAYSLAVSGATTVKSLADSHSFFVDPATIMVPKLEIERTSLQKTETAEFGFMATYPSGVQLQSGSAIIRLTMPNSTIVELSPYYNSTIGMFRASYTIPLSAGAGPWAATLEPGSFDDGYGNSGPSSSQSRGFTVQPAAVTVFLSFSNQAYVTGETIILLADVNYQDGTEFSSGIVNASLSLPGLQGARWTQLSYDQTAHRWFGNFGVATTDPSGLWLVQVTAADPYGNHGTGSSSLTVTALPLLNSTQSTLLYSIVLAAIAVLVTALGVFYWPRRRVARRELKLDLNILDREVGRVQGKDFFKRINEQVSEERDRKKQEQ